MAAVFLLFMWLMPNKKQEQNDSRDDKASTEQVSNLAAQPFGANEKEWLVNNISNYGTVKMLPDSSRVTTLSQGNVNLSLKGDSVYGTVTVNGRALDWNDVSRADLSKMSAAEQHQAVEAVRAISNNMGKYGKFAKFTAGENKTIRLENDVLALDLSSKSGSITRAELKDYDTEYSADETKKVKKKVVIFDGDRNKFNFQIPLPQPIETADLYFNPVQLNDSTVRMTLEVAPNAWWAIEYTLPKGDSYLVKVNILQQNMADVVMSNNRNLGFSWMQDIHRQEKGRMFEERNSGLYYKFAGGSVDHLSESKNDTEDHQNKVKWIGFKNQFFSSVMIADRNFHSVDFASEVLKNSDYLKHLTADAVVNDYDWSASNPAGFSLYIGPNLYPLLSKLSKNIDPEENLDLTRLIPLGWSVFRWINTLIVIPVFTFLGGFISNYGIIILLLTIFIKLILFPLTYKSYRSQAVMRILAPRIKAINDKYPGQENMMVRQQKTMALYSQAGANPMSGCLPMLLQLPILYAMFAFFPSAIELRGQSFLWAHDLSAPDAIISWSGNIPFITEYFGNHISLFCLLMTITNIAYTYLNMQNSQNNAMPGMKWMMYLMPIMFLVFFNNYAAGLSYYYFVSLLITIGQTFAFRYIVSEKQVEKTMAENAKKPKKKSGFMARLEEAQRQQQAMLREQQKRQGKR